MALTCQGHILEPVVMNPRNVSFGQVSRKAGTMSKKILLTKGDGGPIQPKVASGPTDNFDIKIDEVEAGERYEMHVTLKPPFDSKILRTTLNLETGVKDAPRLSLPVYATMRPRVTPVPRRFVVPATRGPNWKQLLHLEWDDDQPHKILEASINDPKVTVEIEEREGKQMLVLMVPEDYKSTAAVRNVIVKTDDAEMPTVNVPVRFDNSPKRRTQRLGLKPATQPRQGQSLQPPTGTVQAPNRRDGSTRQ